MATAIHSVMKSQMKQRTALVASADSSFRQRVSSSLTGLRWNVREVHGGAQAWGEAMDDLPQTMIVDSWLPDLDVQEFLRDFHVAFPAVDIITNDRGPLVEATASPFRQEVLYALNRLDKSDTAAWNAAPPLEDGKPENASGTISRVRSIGNKMAHLVRSSDSAPSCVHPGAVAQGPIAELVGHSPQMLEVSRRIRRVAPLDTSVLIEGPTGSGKEVVAAALHRLSSRSRKPFVAINCAAIPETLLEAELFGHTRGAFTGAVQGRTGRIEAADGGTLFLDEIGEMPLGLQAKLLRFVESGELQRVGDNQNVRVDVRIISATHQRLQQLSKSGGFRSDLYYRLAVFLIRTPALSERMEDLPLLVDHFLERMGRTQPIKHLDEGAMGRLRAHGWPGNVRELQHVLERASILSGDESVLTASDIEFGDQGD